MNSKDKWKVGDIVKIAYKKDLFMVQNIIFQGISKESHKYKCYAVCCELDENGVTYIFNLHKKFWEKVHNDSKRIDSNIGK